MKLARVRYDDEVFDGTVSGQNVTFDNRTLPLAQVELLVPCTPTKIIAIARNFRAHAAELNNPVPEGEPLFFYKPPSALLDPGGTVVLPKGRGRVDYEGELAVVIAQRARFVDANEVDEFVLGYTCAFDVTARAVQNDKKHFSLAKGFDTFCPVGPWIETDLDAAAAEIETRLNGHVVQRGNTRDLVHSVRDIVVYLSTVLTLEPGDLILTGTPQGVAPLSHGDEIALTIEGIGTLTNRVRG